jgi:hypothetical protein
LILEENRRDFLYFREVIQEGDFDNRSLEVDLQMALDIPVENINMQTEIWGNPQYNIRYNDILIVMYWDETRMVFHIADYFGVFENNRLVGFVAA